MASLFDINRKSDRDFLTDVVGTIYLFAKEHQLNFAQSVQDVGECFLDITQKPDNNIAKEHGAFFAALIAKTARYLLKSGRQNDLNVYSEIGNFMLNISLGSLSLIALLLDALQSAEDAEKQEIFNMLQPIGQDVKKIFNNKQED